MLVKLTEDKYFTGSYATVGKIEGGVEVAQLPNEQDSLKQLAYKLIDNDWVFDEAKYQELLSAKETTEKQPTEIEKLQSDVDYIAMLTGVNL